MAAVTNKDIYLAIGGLRKEVTHKLDLVEVKVDKNTAWINQATGKMTVMFAVVGLGINVAWDFVASRFK